MKQIIFTAILILMFCFAAFAQANKNSCPKIEIVSPNKPLVPGNPEIFTVKDSEEIKKYNLEYVWTASRGEIVKGQGTSKIELIVIPEDFGTNVTLTVKVTGLPKDCADTFTDTIGVIAFPHFDPLTFYGKLSSNEEKAYLDNFFITILQDEKFEGFITLYFNKKTSLDKRIKQLRGIIKWAKFRKFDVRRLTFRISKDKDVEESVTFIAVQGNSRYLNEMTDEEDYKIIKAEELEQTIKEIFPKK